MNLFDFTHEDLKLNQRGKVSPRQREWLNNTARGIRSMSGMNITIAVGFLFFGLCLILGLYLQNEDTRAALFANPLNLLVFPATILIVAVILTLSVLYMGSLANRLAAAQVQSAQGKVRLEEEHGEGGTAYYVFVGKKKFAFGEDMSRVFREGEKYKVYYCKSGVYEMVLSYEKVGS
ncbi:MAG TPA: hypothetical protein VFQ23_01140 [Anaerolineales bacterium]|nr:hypothetical protein [Anaerolineales bacterium]